MALTTYIFSFCGHIGRVGPREAAAETLGEEVGYLGRRRGSEGSC